jgi:hypothetical protein
MMTIPLHSILNSVARSPLEGRAGLQLVTALGRSFHCVHSFGKINRGQSFLHQRHPPREVELDCSANYWFVIGRYFRTYDHRVLTVFPVIG